MDIKSELLNAIERGGSSFVMLDEPLNDELIYRKIFDTYFKNITLEEVKEFVNISNVSLVQGDNSRNKKASFNLKLIIDFSIEDRINLLKSELELDY